MKRFFFLISFLSAFLTNAQTVSFREAQQVATHFFGASKMELSSFHIQTEGKDTLAYFFNSAKGFVLISGDRNIVPILAYSLESRYEAQQIVPAAEMWFNHYYSQIRELKGSKTVNIKAQEAWEQILSGSASKTDEEEVRPFITSKWGQEDRYNFYCPRDPSGSFNGRAVTGCVATAMAQILYYFRFPESGTGSYQYEHKDYGTISADFETAHYDYDAMTDVPTRINPAASLLIHHLGVAVDMEYGINASGMNNHKAAYALKTYFKFSPETQYVFRGDSIPAAYWDSLIVTHLHQRIPLYYAGWSIPDIEGHAFVCDGYQKKNGRYYYHFNFGWDGSRDGYFYTDALNLSGTNFNLAQELIINAYPDTALYSYPTPLLSGNKQLTSVSGSFKNTVNRDFTDFTWTIKPDLHNLTSIDFSFQYELVENDTVFITSNDPAVPNIILTDTTGIFTQTYHSNEIHVRFLRHNTAFQSIFKGNYNSAYPVYCSGITVFNSSGVTVSDGSGNANYNNCTRCRYRIFLRNSTDIKVKFTQFETEADKDILYIYDFTGNKYTLLEALSGILTDSVFTFHTNNLLFIFETSATNTFPGWEFIFYDNSDILEHEKSEWNVYPNPTSGKLHVTSDYRDVLHITNIEVFDVIGKKQKVESKKQKAEKETVIDLSHLPAGIYFLQITTDTGIVTRKVIKEQ
jgi:hypothetical protein